MRKLDPDRVRLGDMLHMIEEIESFAAGGVRNRAVLFAAAYCVAVIGEAAGKVSPALRKKHKEVPWAKITGTRHKIIHEYGKLDEKVLWNVVKNELPKLKPQIKKILVALDA